MTSFLKRFIERPVLATVVSLVILLLGLQAVVRLTVREYPEVTSARVIVNTPYTGADAELVRGFITTPLEQAISEAEGIDYLQSTSTQGSSQIEIFLELGYEANDAVAQILSKINQVSNQLPPEAENSILYVVSQDETDALFIAFQSETLTDAEIADYLDRAVLPRIETVDGVQQARIQGDELLALRIWLDPRRMAALGVSPTDVNEALASNNFLAAVGETKGSTYSLPLEATTSLESVDEFERLIVRQTGNAIVRLSEIGRVELGSEAYGSSTYLNGKPAVVLEVEVAPSANLLETISAVREVLPDIQAALPTGTEGRVIYDATIAVEESIAAVRNALWQALLIVATVILLFLGSWRSAVIPVVTMPLAIVGAFFLMSLLGFSLNLLTLLALILAIGTIVDDAVVITENAERHIEEGDEPIDAAKKTVDELSGSVIAMNLVILAVFAPVGFVGGLTGSLFTEFAYTIAAATLMSGVIALTLSPMMCARLLRHHEKKGIARWVDKGFRNTSDAYAKLLSRALDARWLVLAAGAVALVSCWFMYDAAENELAPQEDAGFLRVSGEANPNTSIDQLERWSAELGAAMREFDSVELAFLNNGGDEATVASGGVVMKDWGDRDQTQSELQTALTGRIERIAGLRTSVSEPPTLPGAGEGPPIQFIIASVEDQQAVFEQSENLLRAAEESGLFASIESDLRFDRAQGRLIVDREKASALGVDIATLGSDLATMLSEGYVNYFSLDDRSYQVIPQVDRSFRLRPDQLGDYYVRGGDENLVPLSSFVTVDTEVRPSALSRFNQLNAAILSGVPADGVSLGKALTFLQEEANNLPSGFTVDYAGVSRQFTQQGATIAIAFGLAVILVYLTLAAQYESFRDPAIMLVSVPMSLAGALLFFMLGVVSANIYTQIGLLALVGLIIRHGILLVEFANSIREDEGLSRREAIEKAASLRLRSILMTTISTVVGMIPLLIAGSGPGAASRFAISFVLGVGMTIGTVFTLFVVPTLYTVVAAKRGAEAEPVRVDETENRGTNAAQRPA